VNKCKYINLKIRLGIAR